MQHEEHDEREDELHESDRDGDDGADIGEPVFETVVYAEQNVRGNGKHKDDDRADEVEHRGALAHSREERDHKVCEQCDGEDLEHDLRHRIQRARAQLDAADKAVEGIKNDEFKGIHGEEPCRKQHGEQLDEPERLICREQQHEQRDHAQSKGDDHRIERDEGRIVAEHHFERQPIA